MDIPYSRRDIIEAGKLLGQRLELNDVTRDAFRTAHAWRASHVDPMHRLRQQLAGRARTLQVSGTAARLKRMQSIRRKLARAPQTLLQMQDLAGCRAIAPTIQEVNTLIERYRSDPLYYVIGREQDHLTRAKPDGYRSHHLILKPTRDDGEPGRQQVEIQLRTRLQHAWATAVEAVGLVRGEDIKGGGGDPRWRRFFRLMSADIALAEGCEPGDGAPLSERELSEELRELAAELNAVRTLQDYNLAISQAIDDPSPFDRFFLIEYRSAAKTIRVTAHAQLPARYLALEQGDNDSISTVVVEVDRVEDLKTAYPNYFLDVSLFIDHLTEALNPLLRARRLKAAISGQPPDTDLAPTERPRPGGWRPNMDWMRQWSRRR